jgi:2,4-diaminopentanoate dehydrogenase
VERPVKAVVVGVGAMGAMCTRFMLEKGVDVVGAVSRESHVGEDLGNVCGLERPLGVTVTADLPSTLVATAPDLAVVCVATFLADTYDLIAACVRQGVSVVTTAEELLYSWRTQPSLTAALDAFARASGATVLGSGYTDHFWGGEVFELAGCCQEVQLIEGVGQFNIDDYGPQVARNNHVGESVAQFDEAFSGEARPPAFFQAVADLLCAHLGLTVAEVRETIKPATAEVDVPCTVLDLTVKAGDVTGKVTVVDVTTREGAKLHLELQERLYLPGETDLNRWVIHGTPDVILENPQPATDVLTCAILVNRIPDVLNAPPGYITPDLLPTLRYRPRPLHTYVTEETAV